MKQCVTSDRLICCVVIVSLCALSVGCSRGLESQVSGIVTLDAKPIGPGIVNFAPVTGGQANPAIGTILPDGSYTLSTSRTSGLTAGKYRVAVTVYEPIDVQPGERSTVMPKLLTPERYNSVDTSGLEFEVKLGRNTIDIKLSSDGSSGQAP